MAVYFIQDAATGLIKIGFAEDPWKRFSKIQSDCPSIVEILAIEDGGLDREAYLHATYSAARSRGEWFNPASDLMAYIAHLGVPAKPKAKRKTRGFWNGFTDSELARAGDLCRPMLCHVRNGRRRPTPKQALKIQEITGLSAVKLVFGFEAT